ncbi:hypothetical protein AB0H73_06015 [Streptomyces olivoreticuli]
MARGHGRIQSAIWDDPDFLTLTAGEQRLFLFLISQPSLTHAGLLPLTPRRWAQKARGLTPSDVDHHLQALARARFIVVDHNTEELLIRTFMRHEGIWKQPRVMGSMAAGALSISSVHLRRALRGELDRIPLDQLNASPPRGRSAPSIRDQIAQHIEALREALEQGDATPSAGGQAPPSPTPSPLPSGTPPETAYSGVAVQGAELADRMLEAWWRQYGRRTAQGRKSVRTAIAEALANGNDSAELWQAITHLGDLSKPVTGGTLQFAYSRIRQPALPAGGGAHSRQQSSGVQSTGTDRRLADHYALISQMELEEQSR